MIVVKYYKDMAARLYKEMDKADAENDRRFDSGEITGEEYDAETARIGAEYIPRLSAAQKMLFAVANASQPRSEWFAAFCGSLRNAQRLTEKQRESFMRYAKRKSGSAYRAIVNYRLYTLTHLGTLYIEDLPIYV